MFFKLKTKTQNILILHVYQYAGYDVPILFWDVAP